MVHKPTISVVIPTYNCSDYILDCINSVLKQTYIDYEIIVVDDGSTDSTRAVVSEYLQKGNIKYFYQPHSGVSVARNIGINAALGEYIALLDSDDEWHPELLETCLNRINEENADCCIIDILRIEKSENTTMTEIYESPPPVGEWKDAILEGDFIRWLSLVRKKALVDIGSYDVKLKAREDWDLNIRLIWAGMKFCHVNKPLYLYKIRKGSLTKGRQKLMLDATRNLLKKHHKSLADSGDHLAARIYAHKMWRLAHDYLIEARSYTAFVSSLMESLRYDLSISRLLHPFVFHVNRLLSGKNRS